MQVGVTAMLIASKYEEIWAPEVRRLSHTFPCERSARCRFMHQTREQ